MDDIAAVMAAAMAAENRRREVASQAPGVGALLPLPQPVSGAGVGLSAVPMPVVGAGYSAAEVPPAPLQVVSDHGPLMYGAQAPVYAADEVGGVGFQGGRQEAPIRVLVGTRSAPADGVTVLSAPSRPSLLGRLAGWLRGRSR